MKKPDEEATLRCAEWVLPGHPDKLSDAVADALVQAAVQRQAQALCAIEVAVHRDDVYLTGRLACEGSASIDLQALVRGVYRSAGYGGHWRPAPQDIRVGGNLCVDALVEGEAEIRSMSDDQSVVCGYAVDLPQIGWIPPEQWLAREVARRLFALVWDERVRLCPDGKVMVVLAEHAAQGPVRQRRWTVKAVSLSLLAACPEVALERMARACVQAAIDEGASRLPGWDASAGSNDWAFVLNGSGTFELGGPEGDNGLSGKKLLLDHYGPRVPIGGTAMSGKDFHKPDRAGTLMARRLARLMVASGVADDVCVQFMTFPGDMRPRWVRAWTPHGELADAQRWLEVMAADFIRAAGWWVDLDLVEMARWGWFGGGGKWEQLGLC